MKKTMIDKFLNKYMKCDSKDCHIERVEIEKYAEKDYTKIILVFDDYFRNFSDEKRVEKLEKWLEKNCTAFDDSNYFFDNDDFIVYTEHDCMDE
jgi:stalled ribosome rescue protein Dom34